MANDTETAHHNLIRRRVATREEVYLIVVIQSYTSMLLHY
jgi:hypothetical protein